jgi:hypothetical protein
MRPLLTSAGDFLRGRGAFARGEPLLPQFRLLLAFIALFGGVYGAVMGSYGIAVPGHWIQMVYAAVKVSLLLLVTTALCLPSFFVINSLAGLREDFGEALQAIVAAQSCLTIVLASLSPVTLLFYLSLKVYGNAVLLNAVMFGMAALAAQAVMRRHYGVLLRRSGRHRPMLYLWFALYAFVGIQMGWVLRPFIGDPGIPVQFLREEAWDNAYLVILRLFTRFLAP